MSRRGHFDLGLASDHLAKGQSPVVRPANIGETMPGQSEERGLEEPHPTDFPAVMEALRKEGKSSRSS